MALLVLAATLIVFMLGMVIYDTGDVARDNMEVQAAADTAAWSQSAVEARSMNMLAFTNVGKKVTFGMTSYYQALLLAYAELLIITVALAVLCWIAAFFTAGGLAEVCRRITAFAAEIAYILFEEAPDIAKFEADLNLNYFADDMKAFDDYQSYMLEVTPWWSWAEAYVRGTRNGATAVSGWPVPDVLDSIPQNTGTNDALPVQKPDDIIGKGYMQNMCMRLYSNSPFGQGGNAGGAVSSDVVVHTADYLLKSCWPVSDCQSKAPLTEGWERPVIVPLTGLMAAAQLPVGCAAQAGIWEEGAGLNGAGSPFEIQMFDNQAEWLMKSSNLVFAYRHSMGRNSNTGGRQKYQYLSAEHNQAIPIMHDATGNWSMARSEISYQFGSGSPGSPDLWHPSWTVRMRPVAMPGEWEGLGENITLNKAWHDALAYLIAGAAVSTALGGDLDVNAADVIADIARAELATRGMDDKSIEGVAK